MAPRRDFHLLSPLAHNTVFASLGLESYEYKLHETASFSDRSVLDLLRSPAFGGAAVTMPHKAAALQYMDTLGPEVEEIGSMNTVVVTGFVQGEDGKQRAKLEGRNTDVEGIRRALLSTLPEAQREIEKPFGEGRSAFIIGGGGTTRAAVYALSSMGLSPIFLVNRDPTETASIISTPAFAKYDLRALEKEEQWSNEEAERIACGVGAIPSFQPQTEGEKMVYRLAELVFESSGKKEGKRPLLEMAYKPHVTLMYKLAERHGWHPIGGIEALIHQAFAQDGFWLLDSPHTRIDGLASDKLSQAGAVAAQKVREAAGAPGA
ncbi:hypothetical protein Rhopal_007777-T1 [Rhodotorula paludigena]|uniref:Shikimate dehydrogenase substrate binding N-terminal domain-containing protein n=1 Tax=Rhodotorula paludigena TaxID=86838 RepID=A0AAV5GQL2_9BASI|nr:hypothetical protein Rhopal_007777-T1 [Rhodotorula paludigena]